MEEIFIEGARPEHGPAIEELEREAFPADPIRLVQAAFARKNDPVIVLVAVRRGLVCGYVTGSTHWNGRSLNLWVMALAVDPSARNQGVGRRLLGGMKRASEALGATRLRVLVRPENEPAMRVYRAAGFRVLARQPDGLGPGRELLTMVCAVSATGDRSNRLSE